MLFQMAKDAKECHLKTLAFYSPSSLVILAYQQLSNSSILASIDSFDSIRSIDSLNSIVSIGYIDSIDSIDPIDSIVFMLHKVCETIDFSKLYIIPIIFIPLTISTRSAPSRLSRA